MSLNDSIFILNGVSSDTMGVRIQVRPDRISPTRNFYEGSPSNRNGTVLRDKGTYSDASLKLTCFYETYKTDKTIDDVLDWLTTNKFVPLVLNYDSDYEYQVMNKTGVTLVAADWEHTVYTFILTFVVRAMKKSISLNKVVALSNSKITLTNPFNYIARPYIDISSETSFKIEIASRNEFEGYSASQSYTFSNPNGDITIDSENRICSKPKNLLGQQFPYLLPGTNTVTISGIDSGTLETNYCRKVG